MESPPSSLDVLENTSHREQKEVKGRLCFLFRLRLVVGNKGNKAQEGGQYSVCPSLPPLGQIFIPTVGDAFDQVWGTSVSQKL